MKNQLLCLFLPAVAFSGLAAGSGPYEAPPVLRAVDRLPADLLQGPHHSVDPEVRTDGFMTYFTIQSDYGVYKAASLEEAERRIAEIYAIAALDEMSRAAVVGKGVVEGVKRPFLAVKSVVTRPSETANRVGESLGRWVERGKLSLRKVGKKARQTAEDARQSYDERRQERRSRGLAEQEVWDRAIAEGRDPDAALSEYRRRRETESSSTLGADSDVQRNEKRIQEVQSTLEKAVYRYLGYDKARRRLAHELGVDPYSTNLELQERLDAMAWALWVGQFGTGYAMPSNELLGYVEDVNSLVWTSHPKDLEVQNRKELKAMGVDAEVIDALFDHPYYTTSDRTRMVADLVALDGVPNRDHFFRLAVAADSRLLGAFYRRSARMLALSHDRRPLERIVAPTEKIAVAINRRGELLLLLAVDHTAWTEPFDLLVGGVERQTREAGFEGAIVLMLGGDLTETARREIEAVGWIVETGTLDRSVGPSPEHSER